MRELATSEGRTLTRMAVTGVLLEDDSVSLVDVDIDLEAGWEG